MIGIADAFAPSYARARVKFLEAAATAGAAIATHPRYLAGIDAEVLALDTALCAPKGATRLLIVSSGCHGVEGYGGSGVQVFALHDREWRDKAYAAGVAVLYLHALNPWGFSFGRRVTAENVDVNRNFRDFSKPLPANERYREVHALLLPEHWPPDAANQAALDAYVAEHGAAALQAAATGGQHEFADGLFFGGQAPIWSNQTLRALLREQLQGSATERLGWIDIHTGLGPTGIGERIFGGHAADGAGLARAQRWWGQQQRVTSVHDGSSASARVTGTLFEALYDEAAQIPECTPLALEFGTVPLADVMLALRAEQWLNLHPDAPAPLAASIRQQLRAAFHVDTDAWKGQLISQARQAMFQAVEGLAA